MGSEYIIYRNGRGEVKHYAIQEVSRDATHIKAIHDGAYKTFRHDSVLERLGEDDDPASHLAYWQNAELPKNNERAETGSTSKKATRLAWRDKSAPKAASRNKEKSARRPIQWRDFWLGIGFAVFLLALLLIFGPAPDSETAVENEPKLLAPQTTRSKAPQSIASTTDDDMPPDAIYSEDVDGEWPLTLSPPVIAYCPAANVLAIRVVSATYPINGLARSYGADRGWQPLETIWKRSGDVARVNIGPLTEAVKAACKKF